MQNDHKDREPQTTGPARVMLRDWARRGLEAYRMRAETFGGDLFGGHAWEMLLHLSVAENGVSLHNLAGLVGGPPTLAVRCVKVLSERGLVAAEDHDGESRLVLTGAAVSGLISILRPLVGMTQI